MDQIKNDSSETDFFEVHQKSTKKTPWKKLAFICLTIGIIVLAAGYSWQNFRKPTITEAFSLTADKSDPTGIETSTSFTLKSNSEISTEKIKNLIKIEPQIDFSINKSLISGDFEIKPKDTLKTNKIYKISVTKSDFSDHEYSWAFQTKAEFQIIQTIPANKATTVPTNSGIEIKFNRDNLNFSNAKDYFSISPEVDGRLELNNDTLVFVPKSLNKGQIYDVTIKKGLEDQSSHDALKDDYKISFETNNSDIENPSSSYYRFPTDFIGYLPTRPVTIEYYSYNVDDNDLNISVYKFANADKFISSYKDYKANYDKIYWSLYNNSETGYFNTTDEQKLFEFKPTLLNLNSSKYVQLPQNLEAGYYLIDATLAGKHRPVWVESSPLANYFSVSNDKSVVWLEDFQKQEPASGFSVSYADKKVGTTNSDGVLEFSTPEDLKHVETDYNQNAANELKYFKAEKSGYNPQFIITDNSYEKGSEYWNYLSSDKSVYKLSDTVRFWGIVKGRDSNLRQKKITVGIYDGWFDSLGINTKSLAEQDVLVSQFDTIQGEFSYKGIGPGSYSLIASIDGKIVSRSTIEILSYSKPAYQISVSPSKTNAYAGEKLSFGVKASFFEGTPVENLALKYYYYWGSKQFSGELALNNKGEGSLELTPEYNEKIDDYWPKNFEVTFTPKLAEEGEINGVGSVLIFGPDIYLSSNQTLNSTDNYHFSIKANNLDLTKTIEDNSDYWRNEYIGDPASGKKVTAQVIKVTYTKEETGEYYDYISKTNQKTYKYNSQEQSIDEISGTTDKNGNWSFDKTLQNQIDIQYKAIFSVASDNGRNSYQALYVYSSPYYSTDDFIINLKNSDGKVEFSTDEKVNLAVDITKGEKQANSKVMFIRYQNSIDNISLKSGLTHQEEFKNDFAPNVRYRAVVLGPNGFKESDDFNASFKKYDKNLNVEINADKESYKPKDTVNLNILVKDTNNKPVSSEVNISSVDEAIFHILPEQFKQKIIDSLYSNIYTSLVSGASDFSYVNSMGAEKGGCFVAGTPVLMADNSSLVIEKVRVGDKILTFDNSNSKKLVPAVVQGISKHLVSDYLIINDNLKITPEHKIYLNSKWDYAGNAKVGDKLINSKGQIEAIYSIKSVGQTKTEVYNIVVNNYHTYIAGNYYVHNAEKGGGYRTDFPDIATFQTVQTGNDGKANVTFVLPDSITSWRTSAKAFATDSLKAGESVKNISTSMPFFVDSTANDSYLLNDSVTMKLRVSGNAYQEGQETEFLVNVNSAGINKTQKSKDNTVYFELGKLPAGLNEIQITASQGSYSDSILKKINVVESYFKTLKSTSYDLTTNTTNIAKNADGYTNLIFTDSVLGKFYNSLASLSFSSGNRLDQTITNYLATILLKKYYSEEINTEIPDLYGYNIGDGLAQFGYGEADLELSAKSADVANEIVFKDRLINYFNRTLADNKTDLHRVALSLYGLASLGEPVLGKINYVNENNLKDMGVEDKIYLALAYAKIGAKEQARELYIKYIEDSIYFKGNEAWLKNIKDNTKFEKLNSTVGMLASYLEIKKDAWSLFNHINKNAPEKDLNILEKIAIIKSELEHANQLEKISFGYTIGEKTQDVSLDNGKSYLLKLSGDDVDKIKFSNVTGKVVMLSTYEKATDVESLEKDSRISLSREYLVNGKSTNSFNEGDLVLVRLTPSFSHNALIGSYQLVDYLPSGLKPVTQTSSNYYFGSACDQAWYPNKIIGNSVYFSINNSLGQCEQKTISYYARVVSKGSYTADRAQLQSLENLDSITVSSPASIEIK